MSRRTPLLGVLAAEGISFLGTRISMIAIPWFVLSTTGSATQTGLVAAAEITPLVLLVPTQVCYWSWNQADILLVCYSCNVSMFLTL